MGQLKMVDVVLGGTCIGQPESVEEAPFQARDRATSPLPTPFGPAIL